jgi:hypothetical protein
LADTRAWAVERRPAHPLDRLRSLPPTQLVPLGSVRDVTFVSLQKGTDAQQARNVPAELRLHDWSNELCDFSDTAALIDGLDLVIGVDTAVAIWRVRSGSLSGCSIALTHAGAG